MAAYQKFKNLTTEGTENTEVFTEEKIKNINHKGTRRFMKESTLIIFESPNGFW
jgi:hypothetical protein